LPASDATDDRDDQAAPAIGDRREAGRDLLGKLGAPSSVVRIDLER
jgi:hypothetical protein